MNKQLLSVMKFNNIIAAVVCFAVVSLSACNAVKENFGGGVDMSQQDQVNKIPGIIAKKYNQMSSFLKSILILITASPLRRKQNRLK
ncbi:hypothetical protein [Niabella hibiscisoli]|uniref:hypothetical protein n=1 Tax=Niabella hibiscisoli TaxID=1825928 RepID=UPI001F0E348F|nr:hypothetical protein [Niabella hibiscisoli]MCH5718638.1 hypothetical protein [Niabella hibiscisoli]